MSWSVLKEGLWSGVNYWTAGASIKARIDPHMVWADATNFVDLSGHPGPVEWVPIIIELKAGNTAKDFARQMRNESWLRVPPAYAFPAQGLGGTTFCTAVVKKQFFTELGSAPLNDYIERFELGFPVITPSLPNGSTSVSLGSSNGPVVVGVLDDGLAFAHRRFRKKDGSSRVEYFWIQDGSSDGKSAPGYGNEFFKTDIDEWLREAAYGKLVDEDKVYRLAGYRGVSQRAAHGTHVMDLACGEDPVDVKSGTPRIVCVQLPRRPNRGGTPLAVHLLDGIRYILDRADRIARENNGGKPATSPVVVNLSYANMTGPHDGSSILEKAIDQLIEMRREVCRFCVVLPSGNSHLSRCHARLAPDKDGFDLRWRILPDCRTPSFMEIWLPANAGNKAVEIEITPPAGDPSDPIEEGQAYTWRPGRDVLCTAVYLDRVANGKCKMIAIAVAPTFSTTQPKREVAPSGTWKIKIRNTCSEKLEIDAWIQRNENVFGGLPYGRQSRFEDPKYETVDSSGRPVVEDNDKSHVLRKGTINAIATGEHTIVVGACRRSDGAAAPYSAAGPARANRQGPDVMAPGDDAAVFRGVRAAGTRSGSSVAINGTSVAAPLITRWVASKLAAGGVDRAAVSAEAERQESDPDSRPGGKPYPKERPPKKVGGDGRIDLPPKKKRGRR